MILWTYIIYFSILKKCWCVVSNSFWGVYFHQRKPLEFLFKHRTQQSITLSKRKLKDKRRELIWFLQKIIAPKPFLKLWAVLCIANMLKVISFSYDEDILQPDIMAAQSLWMRWSFFVTKEHLKPFSLVTNNGGLTFSHSLVHLQTSLSIQDYYRSMIGSWVLTYPMEAIFPMDIKQNSRKCLLSQSFLKSYHTDLMRYTYKNQLRKLSLLIMIDYQKMPYFIDQS